MNNLLPKIKEIFDVIKSSNKHLVGAALGCYLASLVFPSNPFGIKHYFYAVSVFCISVVFVNTIWLFGTFIHKWYTKRKKLALAKRRLHNLDGIEKEFLLLYIKDKIRCKELILNSASIVGLIKLGIVIPPPRTLMENERVSIEIAEWAFDYLKRNPELLHD